MNLFELFVKLGVDDQASDKLKNISSKLGNGLKTAAKVGVAAVGAASTAIVALGKIGLEYNSQMEQYTTNFNTMLGSQEAAVKKVEELKKFAASTPLSMDDLAKGTQTLLAFGVESENSTKILRQLGDIALGDADKMQRLSTAFGKATAAGKVTGDTVQQMIDAGWNPLIQISKAAGETMEETQKRMSEGAISVEELQAAMEAVTSGTGQFAGGMEAASHTTQGLISTLKDNAKALVGDVFMPISEGLLGEVLPSAIEAVSSLTTAFKENGISGMIEAAGEIVGELLAGIATNAPSLIESGADLLISIADGLVSEDNAESLAEAALNIIETLSRKLVEFAGVLGKAAFELVGALGDELAERIPGLSFVFENLEAVVIGVATALATLKVTMAMSALIDGLTKAWQAYKTANEGATVAQWLMNAAMNANPIVLIVTLIAGLVAAIITLWNTNEGFRNAVIKAWESIKSAADKIFSSVVNFFKDTIPNAIKNLVSSALTWGKDLIDNFVNGIKSKISAVTSAVSSVANKVKRFLGFSEPEEGPLSNFHTYAPDMMNLFAKGIRDNEDVITDQIEKSFDFGERTIKFGAEYGDGFGTASVAGATSVGTSIGNVTINIDGAKYSDESSLAEAIADALQNMTDRRAAVYA